MKKIFLLFSSFILAVVFFSSCSLENDINYNWKVKDAVPENHIDLSNMGVEGKIIYFEDGKFQGEEGVSKGYEKFMEKHSLKKEDVKDLKQFNSAMRSVGFESDNLDNFYFFNKNSDLAQICFVLVDDGRKLIALAPFNRWDEEENYSAVLFERVEINK